MDAVTFLSDQPVGSAPDEFLRRHFGDARVEATAGNPDATRPDHAAVVDRYRACFSPDDPAWERAAYSEGSTVLDAAVRAVAGWHG